MQMLHWNKLILPITFYKVTVAASRALHSLPRARLKMHHITTWERHINNHRSETGQGMQQLYLVAQIRDTFMCGYIPVTLAPRKTVAALGLRFVWPGRRTGGSLCLCVSCLLSWYLCQQPQAQPTNQETRLPASQSLYHLLRWPQCETESKWVITHSMNHNCT